MLSLVSEEEVDSGLDLDDIEQALHLLKTAHHTLSEVCLSVVNTTNTLVNYTLNETETYDG